METVVFVLSIMIWFLCPVIIGLILLQGAAGDISSAFGGGGQLDSTLGVGAHRKMSKVTGFLAGIFFVMILILAYQGRGSLRDAKIKPAEPTVPAPAAKPAADLPVKPDAAAPAQPEIMTPAPATAEAAKPEVMVPAPAQPEVKAPAQPEAAVPMPAQPEVKAPAADPAPVAAPVVPAPLPLAPVVPPQPAPEAKP